MPGRRMMAGVVLAALALAAALVLWHAEMPFGADSFHAAAERAGPFGPLLIALFMVAGVVISRIPSGPIAIAAGALCGMAWGAGLTIAGAQIGAMIAFLTARWLGHDAIRRADTPLAGRIAASRAQAALMAVVFLSRLVPFISFNAVSYAAGLTPLSFWRFAAATLAGVVPISTALAAMRPVSPISRR